MYENNDDEWKLPISSGVHAYDCIAFKSDVFVVHYQWHCRNEKSLTYNSDYSEQVRNKIKFSILFASGRPVIPFLNYRGFYLPKIFNLRCNPALTSPLVKPKIISWSCMWHAFLSSFLRTLFLYFDKLNTRLSCLLIRGGQWRTTELGYSWTSSWNVLWAYPCSVYIV